MQIHHYDPKTFEYLRSGEARLSPADAAVGREAYLVPALAADAPPPAVGPNEAAVWTGTGWEVRPDFRGTAHYDPATGLPRIIERLGETPKVTEGPPPELNLPRWDGAGWVEGESREDRLKRREWRVLGLRRDLEAAGDLSIRGGIESELRSAEAELAVIREEAAGGAG